MKEQQQHPNAADPRQQPNKAREKILSIRTKSGEVPYLNNMVSIHGEDFTDFC
jgi:hypothetical protein